MLIVARIGCSEGSHPSCQGQVLVPQNGQGHIPQLKCSIGELALLLQRGPPPRLWGKQHTGVQEYLWGLVSIPRSGFCVFRRPGYQGCSLTCGKVSIPRSGFCVFRRHRG